MPYKCTSCDKRFRYKVSQRTHKCKAQPPGAVVRQFGDLVQRLLLQHTQNGNMNSNNDIGTNEPSQTNIEITSNNEIVHPLIIQPPQIQAGTDNEANNFVQQLLMQQPHNGQTNNDVLQETLSQSLINIEVQSNDHCSTVNEECLKRLLYGTGDVT